MLPGRYRDLYLTSSAYNVWLFAKQPLDWRSELRLPLIQLAYSKKLSVGVDEIRVGIYDFSAASYTDYCFNEHEIADARLEFTELIQEIFSYN